MLVMVVMVVLLLLLPLFPPSHPSVKGPRTREPIPELFEPNSSPLGVWFNRQRRRTPRGGGISTATFDIAQHTGLGQFLIGGKLQCNPERHAAEKPPPPSSLAAFGAQPLLHRSETG
ncbi:hypothetical protein F4808DRAFT_428952 [Astrocystis sublimbata]|nr:hypothetical protein F4808DRAFT_428952 [Astrocystis sublimbata]